jgi:hypothetical protein
MRRALQAGYRLTAFQTAMKLRCSWDGAPDAATVACIGAYGDELILYHLPSPARDLDVIQPRDGGNLARVHRAVFAQGLQDDCRMARAELGRPSGRAD